MSCLDTIDLKYTSGFVEGGDIELIDIRFQILHSSFKIIDCVPGLQFEIALVIMNASNNEIAKLTEGLKHVLMTAMEKIKATNRVNFSFHLSLR